MTFFLACIATKHKLKTKNNTRLKPRIDPCNQYHTRTKLVAKETIV